MNWTCTSPVSPGSTDRISSYSCAYSPTNSGTSGRGPTIDIWPRSTCQNWGSSSSRVACRKRPIGVSRASLNAVSIGPRASLRILRNLSIANGLPPRPTRTER